MSLACPTCGAEVGETEAYCPKCGTKMFDSPPMTFAEQKKALSPTTRGVFQVLSVVLVIIIGIPALLVGGCSLLLGGYGAFNPSGAGASGVEGIAMIVGFLGIVIFGALLWWAIRSRRS